MALVVMLPDHVFKKIPAVVCAAAATAAMVVLLNWPEMTSLKSAGPKIPLVSNTVPLTVIVTETLLPAWVKINGPMHTVMALGAHVSGTRSCALKLKFASVEIVSQLSILTGTPTGKKVNGALPGASTMSLMVPG